MEGELLRVADLVIDLGRLSVRRGGEPVDLTPTEFQILSTLARHPGRIFTRAQLLDAARGDRGDGVAAAVASFLTTLPRA